MTLTIEQIPTGWRAFYDPEGLTGEGSSELDAARDLADKLDEALDKTLTAQSVRARALVDVTRERDEAHNALGSLQELLAKQIAVPKSSGAIACAACGWCNDRHPDDCPVKRGLEIIERALTPEVSSSLPCKEKP